MVDINKYTSSTNILNEGEISPEDLAFGNEGANDPLKFMSKKINDIEDDKDNELIGPFLTLIKIQVSNIYKGLIEAGLNNDQIIKIQTKLNNNSDILNDINDLQNEDVFLKKVLGESFDLSKLLDKTKVYNALYDLFSINRLLNNSKNNNYRDQKDTKLSSFVQDLKYKISVEQARNYMNIHRKDFEGGNFYYDNDTHIIYINKSGSFAIHPKLFSDYLISILFYDEDGNLRNNDDVKNILSNWGDKGKSWIEKDDNFKNEKFSFLRTLYFKSVIYSKLCIKDGDRYLLKEDLRNKLNNNGNSIEYIGSDKNIQQLLQSTIGQKIITDLINYYDYQKMLKSSKDELGIGEKFATDGSISGLNVAEELSQSTTIYINSEPIEVSGINDFIVKIYQPLLEKYKTEKKNYAISPTNPQILGPKSNRVNKDLLKKINTKYIKLFTTTYIQYLIASGTINENTKNSMTTPFGSTINLNLLDNSDRKQIKENMKKGKDITSYLDKIYVDNYTKKLGVKYNNLLNTRSSDKAKGSLSIISLVGASVVTGLSTVASGGVSIFVDAGIFYASEKAINGIGNGIIDYTRSGVTILDRTGESFANGFLQGISLKDKNNTWKPGKDILEGEIVGYLTTLAMFGVMKPLSGVKANPILKTITEAEGLNIASQIIGTSGEYIKLIINSDSNNANLLLQQSINNFVDPAEHTRGFGHSLMTLGILKSVNAVMEPVYVYIATKNTNINSEIVSMLDEADKIQLQIKSLKRDSESDKNEILSLQNEFIKKVQEIKEKQDKILSTIDPNLIEEIQYLGYAKYRTIKNIAEKRLIELKKSNNIAGKQKKIEFWEKILDNEGGNTNNIKQKQTPEKNIKNKIPLKKAVITISIVLSLMSSCNKKDGYNIDFQKQKTVIVLPDGLNQKYEKVINEYENGDITEGNNDATNLILELGEQNYIKIIDVLIAKTYAMEDADSNKNVVVDNYQKAITFAEKILPTLEGDEKLELQVKIGNIYLDMGNKENAKKYFFEAINSYKESHNLLGQAELSAQIGKDIFYKNRKYTEAIKRYKESVDKYTELGNNYKYEQVRYTQAVGYLYQLNFDYIKAQKYLFLAKNLAEGLSITEEKNLILITIINLKLAVIQTTLADLEVNNKKKEELTDKARNLYKENVKFYEQFLEKNKNNIKILELEAKSYNNIGELEFNKGNYMDALGSYENSIKIKTEILDYLNNIKEEDKKLKNDLEQSIGISNLNIGKTKLMIAEQSQDKSGETKNAIWEYLSNSLKYAKNTNDDLAEIYLYMGKFKYYFEGETNLDFKNSLDNNGGNNNKLDDLKDQGAYDILLDGFQKGIEENNITVQLQIVKEIKDIFVLENKKGNSEITTNLYIQRDNIYQSLVNSIEQINKTRNANIQKIINENNQLSIENQNKLIKIMKKQKEATYLTAGILLILLVLLGIGYMGHKTKKRLRIEQELKEILKQKNEELEQKNEEIVQKSKEVSDVLDNLQSSINFAKIIQSTVLPNTEVFKEAFPESFVIYKPRNVVGGDFYWMKVLPDGRKVLATIDCTGHGVPGALLTMLGYGFLETIVNEEILPKDILEYLDKAIKSSQTGLDASGENGMDMSIYILDEKNNKIQFAGANHSLWIVRNGKIMEYKGTRRGIGANAIRERNEFKGKDIDIQPGDIVYTFSDGITDQFGGNSDKSVLYTKKRWKNFLLSISNLPIEIQQTKVNKELNQRKGDNEQTDDIVVIGVKIPDKQSE